jgi:ABC-2 type transport system permease protein
MTPVRGPSLVRMVAAQTWVELLLALRRAESLVVMIAIPTILLVFFGSLAAAPGASRERLDVLVPGILAIAIMSTAMVSLGIATAFERYYNVLKRLGGSPLPRAALLLAKVISILAIELVQILLLLGIAVLALGWRPEGNPGLAIVAVLLGTAAFGGLGLWMAGALRAEATLALANGLYIGLMLLSGTFVSLSALPAFLAVPARVLPATALADLLRAGLTPMRSVPLESLGVLVAWAVLAPLAAALTFRWE